MINRAGSSAHEATTWAVMSDFKEQDALPGSFLRYTCKPQSLQAGYCPGQRKKRSSSVNITVDLQTIHVTY